MYRAAGRRIIGTYGVNVANYRPKKAIIGWPNAVPKWHDLVGSFRFLRRRVVKLLPSITAQMPRSSRRRMQGSISELFV